MNLELSNSQYKKEKDLINSKLQLLRRKAKDKQTNIYESEIELLLSIRNKVNQERRAFLETQERITKQREPMIIKKFPEYPLKKYEKFYQNNQSQLKEIKELNRLNKYGTKNTKFIVDNTKDLMQIVYHNIGLYV